jgi:sarcosine oxidase subunit gamma
MYHFSLTTGSGLALIDLSALPRAGIKGKGLSQWITSKSYEVGEEPNRAYAQRDGVLIARLSPGELMLLANPADPSMDVMTYSLEATYNCYPVRRQDSHYWFAVTGVRCPAMFAKLCGVDLSPDIFAGGTIAQTSVARTSAVIVRHDIEGVLGYYLLGDSSTILYMWTCVVDAMKEFGGRVLTLPASENLEHNS